MKEGTLNEHKFIFCKIIAKKYESLDSCRKIYFLKDSCRRSGSCKKFAENVILARILQEMPCLQESSEIGKFLQDLARFFKNIAFT